jgi:hypothetical protein
MITKKANKNLKLITKIFLVGLLLQFFLQTFVTRELGRDGKIWSIVWMWKELVVIGITIFVAYTLTRQKKLKSFLNATPLKTFGIAFGITIIISLIMSLLNGSGLGTYIMSIKYSLFGFFIFMIFFALARNFW